MRMLFPSLTLALSLLAPGVAQAQSCEETGWRGPGTDIVAQGGRLYDNWWVTCGMSEPQNAHPAYPATVGKQSGATTWRCKECHGWDYQGKDGAYQSGSHFTGIRGVTAYAGREEAAIVAILKDEKHRYGALMSEELLGRIALFVSKGQIDVGARIDAKTKKVSGNQLVGRRIFDKQCIACHGTQGRAMNFSGDPAKPEFVGTIAADNPWEMLHKIRNGQPNAVMDDARMRARASDPDGSGRGQMMMGMHMIRGRAMPASRESLSLDEQLDLLSFLQTLPTR